MFRTALVAMVLALLVALANAYLSFIRPTLETRAAEREHRPYRNISGIPGIGTILVAVGAVAGYGSRTCAVMGLVAMVVDAGGLPWFIVSTWRDRSL